jgi:hypothetical protein
MKNFTLTYYDTISGEDLSTINLTMPSRSLAVAAAYEMADDLGYGPDIAVK